MYISQINHFDRLIVNFVLKYFGRSYNVYHPIFFLAENDNLLKGGVLAILIWYMWFKQDHSNNLRREHILATLIGIFVVMATTMGLAILLPFRQRPFLNPDFSFSSPDLVNLYIGKLSSFPSDHAALFISIATGLFFVSMKAGIFATFYTVIFILLPRIYLGFHYPTDILAGAFIGAGVTCLFNRSKIIRTFINSRILPFTKSHPSVFYALFFVMTYEIADLFSGGRNLISFLYNFYKH